MLNTLTLNLRTVVVYILRYSLYRAIRHIGVFVLLRYSSYRGTRYTEPTCSGLFVILGYSLGYRDVHYTGVSVICKGYFSAGVIFDICLYVLIDPWHGLYVSGKLPIYLSQHFALNDK